MPTRNIDDRVLLEADETDASIPGEKEQGNAGKHVDTIEFLLRNVSFIIKKRGRQLLRNFDITPPQFNALLVLNQYNNITMGELCNRLYLASSTVTDLIDRMEKNGLVIRGRDPQDRRVIRLRILAKGKALIDQVMEARKVYLSAMLGRIEPVEREQLLTALQHLHELMTHEEVRG
ncbi:MAG: MarR family transcriptional regulator [Thermaerobacterales bacterium]